MKISKTHSKNDLVKLINDINIPIIFSHSANKTEIQQLLKEWIESNVSYISFTEDNLYKITSIFHLKSYLEYDSPKKSLTVKEKSAIMTCCKKIIQYCRDCKYQLESSLYETEQEIHDDMCYISQYGDLPSVRRCCRLMNMNLKSTENYNPIISPQVQGLLNEKKIVRQVIVPDKVKIKRGSVWVSFD